jgi:hypothetical protein
MENKIFFNLEKLDEKLTKDLPDEIDLPFLAFSKKWNKNTQNPNFKFDFNLKDLLNPEKTKVIYGHSGQNGELLPGQIIANTYLYDKKIEKREDKDGEYEVITGKLYSNNPQFIRELKQGDYLGFSIEIYPLNNSSIYFNNDGTIYYRQAVMQYIAFLKDEEPAVLDAGIIGKFNLKDFGSENLPKKIIYNSINSNKINMDETILKQLKELIQTTIKDTITEIMSAKETKKEEAKKEEPVEDNQIKMSFLKGENPKKVIEKITKQIPEVADYIDGLKEENKFSAIVDNLKKEEKIVQKVEKNTQPKESTFVIETFTNLN